MRILVTGATGFIGRRTAEALLSDGFDVVMSGRTPPVLLPHGAVFARGDLADASFAVAACEGVDAVIHCAGKAGTWGPYEDYHRSNVLATRNLLEGAKRAGVGRVVNLSSPSIYFQYKHQLNLREGDLPPRFSNAYARTKYEAEQLMKAYHSPSMQTVSLRPRAVIGKGDQNILPRLIRLQKSGALFQIGRGEHQVDITTVDNLIDAIRLCLSAPSAAMGEAYNISNGSPVDFWKFVEDVLRQAELPFKRRRLPYSLVMSAAHINAALSSLLRRQEEPALLPVSVGVLSFSMTLDISKAREQLGYRPKYSTQDGVRAFFEG